MGPALPKPSSGSVKGFLIRESWPLLALVLSFLLFFKEWAHLFTQFFLSLDTSVLYEPVYYWVHQHLIDGKLPLICDNAMHGAPIAAYSMAGVLSPALWLFHWFDPYTFAFNLLFLVPSFIYLIGAYLLGRRLKLSQTASLLLAFIWSYNGHQMAQLDHLNVAWAHAFFPWAFLALLIHLDTRRIYCLLLSSLLLGLNLLSGHPQVFFMECLFFLFWALFSYEHTLKERVISTSLMGLGALIVASPLILFTAECLWGDFQNSWSPIDRFYHSWTPLNFLTMIFPWFFGRTQYDRAGADYWWQYQFVEMQVAFSIVALFFILFFLSRRSDNRRWLTLTFLFSLFMAMGKFTFIYPAIQSLPIFSFFRDPARFWFLGTWALGLAGAYGWDQWFQDENYQGKKLAMLLTGIVISIPLFALILRGWAWDELNKFASLLVSHFITDSPEHTQPLSVYLAQVPNKLKILFFNLDLTQLRVFLPVLFSCGLLTAVLTRKRWNINWLKMALLILVLADLYAFRMPLGNAFYKLSDITTPQVPAAQNRTLTLLYNNTSPLPNQYGEMAYPNMNLMFNRPNLVFDANPIPGRYTKLWADLGWFSWVYKNRNPIGFIHQEEDLRELGVDQIVSDLPLKLPASFQTIQDQYPYVYFLPGTYPKAYLTPPLESKPFESSPNPNQPTPTIKQWDETSALIQTNGFGYLFLQKTFLPGWKAWVNGQVADVFCCNKVLTGISPIAGHSLIQLKYEPASLRLGFFLFFAFFGVFTFFLIRSRLS